jgi:hypothetical protein
MKNIRSLALSLALFGMVAPLSAQSTLDVVLQNDGGNTRISLSWSGDVLTSVAATDDITWSGVGGTFVNYLNGGSQSSSLTGFGVFDDLTTDGSGTINSVQFINDSGTMRLAFFFDTNIALSAGDQIHYVPATDSETILVPFSSFNPGTYEWNNTSDPYASGPFDYSVDLTVVPEPSMFALAGLGGLAMLLFRRRKS